MQNQQYIIEIRAPREKVWHTLWNDKTFREWANIIDEGTYMLGELREGAEVQFISAEGYGVTSLVEKLSANESVTFKHQMDTKEFGAEQRENDWTGSSENYSLTENNGITTLVHTSDIPSEPEEIILERYPKAFQRVKELSEKSIT